MKKLALILCLSLFILTGCANNDKDISRLEERIETLEKQIATPKTNDSKTPSDKISEEKDFSKKVSSIVKSLESVTTVEQYQPIKLELEMLEDEMDNYEDVKEKEYRGSLITKEAYRTIESMVENWEHQLDTAQDNTELKLGIDD